MNKIATTIKWDLPDTDEVTFDKVYLYRATSVDGTYSDLANQVITDNTYTDMNGTSEHWYKVRFWDSDNDIWSDYSTAIQGGSDYGYCSPDDVYNFTPITSTDASYTVISKLIPYATARLNSEINIRYSDEEVKYISNEKQNDLDGSNTTFYSKNFPIGDNNDDGEVLAADITAYTIASDGTRTVVTVSSIDDHKIGKFTVSSAPSGSDRFYISYSYTRLEESTPHVLIKQACAFMTAALATTKISADNFKSVSLGRMRLTKFNPDYTMYIDRYYSIVDQITNTVLREKGKSLIEMV